MKKIGFVLTVSTGINYGSIFSLPLIKNHDDLKEYFSKDYDVSINYIRDKDSVDYLIVPKPFTPFDNENNLPIIEVPAILFMEKDFEKIKTCIDNYFSVNP
ncbi:hypothetical protein CKN86_10770 [Carnobacterium divergens]|uniref:hypothetical protein n=1 Tax=Carnobacterium divergens TaxID=2748 RepID=UPI000D43A680|nr:hypothetical protein [Carnobacterium divergens]MCO6017684.1 hypothetical protein [Carnobacterium divergens]TFI60897.1 hypothetical protein CKN62_10910 [Carnobacterium divergens]TFI87920.1 hypothetical protein CKN84_10800 [Carnobacterium divergens]TFJ02488.1 hypothetical protein CKN86_10770 [Carnobacterium divergens]TFJ03998.1 hypothetical protein CKN65_10810 [Carnobacterium divergens]